MLPAQTLLGHLTVHVTLVLMAVVLNAWVCFLVIICFILLDSIWPTDINECQSNKGNCTDMCVNTIGSFFCTCPTFGHGFQAVGNECHGMYVYNMP